MDDILDAGDLLRRHTTAQLSDELAFFHGHKNEWIPQHLGEFVLLGKHTFGGFYKTYASAVQSAIRIYGPVKPFLIEQITEEEM